MKWNNVYDDIMIPIGMTPDKAVQWLTCSEMDTYTEFSPVAAVVIRMAEMFSAGKFEILNAKTGNYSKGEFPYWEKLLANPNFLQTRYDFLKQLFTYVVLNGWCYALPIYSRGFDEPSQIFLIPPSMTVVECPNKMPWMVSRNESLRKVRIRTSDSTEKVYSEKELILFTDSAAAMVDPYTWLPLSRLRALKYPISNGYYAMESRNSLIVDRGAIGMLTNSGIDAVGTQPLDPEEKDRIQAMYKKSYGLTKDKRSSVIITDANLKWQSMVLSVKELMLHEEHVGVTKDICDVLGYQYRLLSTGEGATYANQQNDMRSVYQNSIIPQADSLMSQLNRGLNLIENGVKVAMNYKDIDSLQESQEIKGKGRLAMNKALRLEFLSGLITRNQWLEAIELDTIDRPEFNKFIFEMTPEERGIIDINTDANPETEQQ